MPQTDRDGRQPLHYAALADDVREIEARLAAGDDPNLGDREGWTPLHFAAQQGALDAARRLLDAGAEVDPVTRFGNTPLFVAVFNSRGHGDLIDLLRAHGANPLAPNHTGQTPLALAHLIANHDVAQFFTDLPSPPPNPADQQPG
jgi:ankyrin repeat protein